MKKISLLSINLLSLIFASSAQERIDILWPKENKNRTLYSPSNPLIYTLLDGDGGAGVQGIHKVENINLMQPLYGTLDISDAGGQEISGICYDNYKQELVGVTTGFYQYDCQNQLIDAPAYIMRYKDNNNGTYTYLGKVPIYQNGTMQDYIHGKPSDKNDIESYILPYNPQVTLGGDLLLSAPTSKLVIYGFNAPNNHMSNLQYSRLVRIEWDYVSSHALSYDLGPVYDAPLTNPYDINSPELKLLPSALTINSIDHFSYINGKPTNYWREDEIVVMGHDDILINTGGYTGNQIFCNVGVAKFDLNGNNISVEPLLNLTDNPCLNGESPSHNGNVIRGAYNNCRIQSLLTKGISGPKGSSVVVPSSIPTYNPYNDPSVSDGYIGNDLYKLDIIGYNGDKPILDQSNSWVVYDGSEINHEFNSNTICDPIQPTPWPYDDIRFDYASPYTVNWEQHFITE